MRQYEDDVFDLPADGFDLIDKSKPVIIQTRHDWQLPKKHDGFHRNIYTFDRSIDEATFREILRERNLLVRNRSEAGPKDDYCVISSENDRTWKYKRILRSIA